MTCQISVVIGNIVEQLDCDGIVNSANERLRAGSGVCGAIYRAAGPELEPYSQKLGPIGVGCAIATPGFLLPNRVIIHTRGPRYLFDSDPPNQLINALESALVVADNEKVVKLAVPAISMGVYAYPPVEAVPILVKTACHMSSQLVHVSEIRFVVISKELLCLFHNSIAAIRDCEEGIPEIAEP